MTLEQDSEPQNAGQTGTAGLFSLLRDGMARTRDAVTEIGADGRVAPVKRLVVQGARTVGEVADKTTDTFTQQSTWKEHHALLESLIDVVSLQQGLIEDLRRRVVALEAG